MRAAFVLVAAGAGRRLGSEVPKAFIDLEGKSLLLRSFDALRQSSEFEVGVVVVSAERIADAERQLAQRYQPEFDVRIVAGGLERQDSVAAGLDAIPVGIDLVMVHDAARPFVHRKSIVACLDAARMHGAATAAVAVSDTVKEVDEQGIVRRTLDRRQLRLIQTPQAFRLPLLRDAHAQAARDGVAATDDAALVERLGTPVWTVAGDADNRKITTAEDLEWARMRLRASPR